MNVFSLSLIYFGGASATKTRNQLVAFQFCGDFSEEMGSTITEYEAYVEESSGKFIPKYELWENKAEIKTDQEKMRLAEK